jgi:hypothetical protein
MHPGGLAALTDEEVAGQDATEQFFALHRFEVLTKPQYQRLIIGTIEGEEPSMRVPQIGDISKVPYAEPTWLTEGYYSPYFSEVRLTTDFSIIPIRTFSIEPSRTTESNAQIHRRISPT